ncbi:MAG: PRC-barrel domain-containing protein [Acetobacteraceae bacterium]
MKQTYRIHGSCGGDRCRTERPSPGAGHAANRRDHESRSQNCRDPSSPVEDVGSSVVNEANETVGSVDDLIVTPDEKAPYAVLSVGGFLGLGTKYVVVPLGSLHMQDKKIVLPGATKDALKALPEFKYSS